MSSSEPIRGRVGDHPRVHPVCRAWRSGSLTAGKSRCNRVRSKQVWARALGVERGVVIVHVRFAGGAGEIVVGGRLHRGAGAADAAAAAGRAGPKDPPGLLDQLGPQRCAQIRLVSADAAGWPPAHWRPPRTRRCVWTPSTSSVGPPRPRRRAPPAGEPAPQDRRSRPSGSVEGPVRLARMGTPPENFRSRRALPPHRTPPRRDHRQRHPPPVHGRAESVNTKLSLLTGIAEGTS